MVGGERKKPSVCISTKGSQILKLFHASLENGSLPFAKTKMSDGTPTTSEGRTMREFSEEQFNNHGERNQ
jgi:hypothetical protein